MRCEPENEAQFEATEQDRMARISRLVLIVAFIAGFASPAVGCPFCDSSTAERVRAGIFNSDFVYHLGVSFAPFSVLIAVLILIYYWPARRPSDPSIGQ